MYRTAKALSVNLVISWEASILDINAVALPYCIAISCHISLYLAIYCHIVYLAVLPYCISCILNADPNQGGHDFDAAKVIVYRMYRCVYNVYVQCIVYNVYYACVLYLFMHIMSTSHVYKVQINVFYDISVFSFVFVFLQSDPWINLNTKRNVNWPNMFTCIIITFTFVFIFVF